MPTGARIVPPIIRITPPSPRKDKSMKRRLPGDIPKNIIMLIIKYTSDHDLKISVLSAFYPGMFADAAVSLLLKSREFAKRYIK